MVVNSARILSPSDPQEEGLQGGTKSQWVTKTSTWGKYHTDHKWYVISCDIKY